MDIDKLKLIISDSQTIPARILTQRDVQLPEIRDTAIIIVGPRRSGKTYRTYQYLRDCFAQGMHPTDVCRLQFNDLRLQDFGRQGLLLIDQAYYALYPHKRRSTVVQFIFDEIHRIDGWEDYILQLLEEPTHRVLITGSTAALLKGDVASALRGKYFPVEIQPFSFGEFVKYHGVSSDLFSSDGQANLRSLFDRYLTQGGYPGLLELDGEFHTEYLQNLWHVMILKDILDAHGEDRINLPVLNHFARTLVSRIGLPMTIRGIMADMAALDLKVTNETLYRLLLYFEDAFMIRTVPVYSQSAHSQNRAYRKVFAADWALANAVAPSGSIDPTRRFENMIFAELKRRRYDVFYYRTRAGYEIDFIARPVHKPDQKPEIYQVCYSLDNKEVLARELRGIPETARFLETGEAWIITASEERDIDSDGICVHVVPAWKWLLSTKEAGSPAHGR